MAQDDYQPTDVSNVLDQYNLTNDSDGTSEDSIFESADTKAKDPETSFIDDALAKSSPAGDGTTGFTEPEPENNSSDDALAAYLKMKGIKDPSKLTFEREDGTQEEVDFKDLSTEDKLQILGSMEDSPNLSDDEINTINFLRQNNLTLSDFVQAREQQAVQQYANRQEQVYTVDQLDDEEVFIADLKYRFPELTDEEVARELESAEDNEAAFAKKVAKLRADYKQIEADEQARTQQQAAAAQQEEYNQMVSSVVQAARDNQNMYDLEIDDQDKEEVLHYLFDRDVNGNSEFSKALQNPEALYKLAWFALKGDEAFETLHSYYRSRISDAASGRKSAGQQPKKVVRTKTSSGSGDDPFHMKGYFNR
jgi:hypothetical protein